MQNSRKLLGLLGVAVLILANGCTRDISRYADRLFRDYQGPDTPGAAVMVIRDGEAVFQQCYGMAKIEEAIPISPNTNFRLASITKQFTATSILMLIERGQLELATNLREIFPEFPPYGEQITIEHLLRHNPGLIDYEDLIPDTATVQVYDQDVLQMMMDQDSSYFPPGSQYRYSNSAYAVLAMIIEKQSGMSFAEFLKKNIFTPAGMTNTVAYENGVSTVPNRAYGYVVEGDSVVFRDQSLTSAVLGDGGIYTSLNELLLWDQILYSDQLLPAETLQQAWTPGLEGYGFGWRIDEFHGHRRLWHAGSTCGFRNVMFRFPDDRLTIVILTNRAEPGVGPLAEKLAACYGI